MGAHQFQMKYFRFVKPELIPIRNRTQRLSSTEITKIQKKLTSKVQLNENVMILSPSIGYRHILIPALFSVPYSSLST